jgi:3-deoxy-D-manno-octulosonic-acid transferase
VTGRHPLLLLYRLAWALARPLLPLVLARRRARGKEDAARLDERRGIASLARPPGRLVWMHGASVGEALALLPLVERMQALGFVVLVTTGTVTSARLLAERLPAGALHQYVPLDAGAYMRRFVETWRPELLVLTESELWPNMLLAARRAGIAAALVNARLSARSFARWSYAKGAIGALLRCIDACLAQTPADAERLTQLGAARVSVCGNLKYDAAPLPADAAALAALRAAIGARPCWVAASIHAGEDEIALAAHQALTAAFPDLLTILAPRHMARADETAALPAARSLSIARRSLGDVVASGVQVYLADTMGEMGLLYRLDAPVFMGKSLARGGGQNPIEPAVLGAAILHGPSVGNFADVYALLDEAGGAARVDSEAGLAKSLGDLLRDAHLRGAMGARAKAVVQSHGGAGDTIMAALTALLERPRGVP